MNLQSRLTTNDVTVSDEKDKKKWKSASKKRANKIVFEVIATDFYVSNDDLSLKHQILKQSESRLM
jgi:hypothetical protein